MQTALTRLAASLIMTIASVGVRAEDALLGMIVDVDIPPQQLATALITLSHQAGIQLQMPAEIVEGLNTSGVHGEMTLSDAFSQLLYGTPLTFRSAGTKTVGIQPSHVKQDPDTGHVAHPQRPDWFVRDMKNLLAKVGNSGNTACTRTAQSSATAANK